MVATVTLIGLKEAQAFCSRMGSAAEAFGRIVALFGSREPYAYGIHYGRHRGGKLARAAGGTHYLERGLDQRRPFIIKAVTRALEQGPQAIAPMMLAEAEAAASASTPFAPAVSGTLRRSLHGVLGRR